MDKIQTLCKGAIVILIWNGLSALATVYDSDGSSTNIQSIHDTLAQNGDTITLPAGTLHVDAIGQYLKEHQYHWRNGTDDHQRSDSQDRQFARRIPCNLPSAQPCFGLAGSSFRGPPGPHTRDRSEKYH